MLLRDTGRQQANACQQEHRHMKIVAISGSPSATSKTAGLAEYVCRKVRERGVEVSHLRVAGLPPEALLAGRASDPEIARAIELIEAADGIIVATPIYKAAYSGLLKAFIDLLPQFAFADKVVLPLATGGTIAHVLALDYGLRPVLQSLWPRHVVQCYFALDRMIELGDEISIQDDKARADLNRVTGAFVAALTHGCAEAELQTA